MEITRKRSLRAIIIGSGLLMATSLVACNGKAKQEAALAIDAAKLSVADAKNAKMKAPMALLIKQADASLAWAERSFEKGRYAKAKDAADSASVNARMALEAAKKR